MSGTLLYSLTCGKEPDCGENKKSDQEISVNLYGKECWLIVAANGTEKEDWDDTMIYCMQGANSSCYQNPITYTIDCTEGQLWILFGGTVPCVGDFTAYW